MTKQEESKVEALAKKYQEENDYLVERIMGGLIPGQVRRLIQEIWKDGYNAKQSPSSPDKVGEFSLGVTLNDFLVWLHKEKVMASTVSARKIMIDDFISSLK